MLYGPTEGMKPILKRARIKARNPNLKPGCRHFEITIGLIATAAMIVRMLFLFLSYLITTDLQGSFLLKGDTSLSASGDGNTSDINFKEKFEYYRDTLVKAKNATGNANLWFVEVMLFFNTRVFGAAQPQAAEEELDDNDNDGDDNDLSICDGDSFLADLSFAFRAQKDTSGAPSDDEEGVDLLSELVCLLAIQEQTLT